MENTFMLASKLKLRFSTTKGELSAEQLWDLRLTDLDTLCVSLERKSKRAAKKSFLETRTEENKIDKLRFDIALAILEQRVEEQKAAMNAAEAKAHNERIDALIAQKQAEQLGEKSIEELEALRKPVA